ALPIYGVGNSHPGFMGWVHGGGTPVGMVAEMLAAGMNANLGGRNQVPLEVERQVISWMRELFSFPADASGVLTAGTSSATLIALHTARHSITPPQQRVVAYASQECHGCIARALDIIGVGATALRSISVNSKYQIDTAELTARITQDRADGLTPWLIVGSAGTVNSGAIDDLSTLAAVAASEGAWFHVDGALGGFAMLSNKIAPRLRGIERADSLAMDFHKWAQVPYDAGMVLLRDEAAHYQSFAAHDTYLQREEQGMAANTPWPCDYGIDLSRSFRALKVWFTIQAFGKQRLAAVIDQCCQLAQTLAAMIQQQPQLELAADISLNIVCFRYRGASDSDHRTIVSHIQHSGLAAPSLTTLQGRTTIRAAIVNHRTTETELRNLLSATLNAITSIEQERADAARH
ncbi:MAG: aminotransferase class V-fold PLP-dependent enzyme, partial [Mariprofundales bacterium]|nr:aminotransferase class V-fold PLP-dependent enzyme [Mariprofundales bacterium]